MAEPPSGPPPKNVSVMIGPQDEVSERGWKREIIMMIENFVRSGYISIDMGKGKKVR